jgi:hypothetical protein
MVAHSLKEIPLEYYGTRIIIAMFKRARHWVVTNMRQIDLTFTIKYYLSSNVILSKAIPVTGRGGL